MEKVNIAAESREGIGVKGALSKIRAEKKVPAVIYGGHKEPVSVTVTVKDLDKIVKAGKNTLVEIALGKDNELALVKEIQYHAVTDNPIHADFQRVSMKDKMDVIVPLKLEGTPADVANYGAIIEHIMREIEVRALVSAIPHEIVLDITPMTINKGIVAGEVKLPEGVELLTDPEAPVVHLMIPKEEEEAPAPAAADAAAAQPESSSTKGKKDEEGNLTKNAASAPAKDAAKK